MQNKNTKVYLSLLTPSALGSVFYTFGALLIIVLHQFSFIEKYLQLPQDAHFMQSFMNWLDRILNSLVGEGVTNAVVVGLFWAVVGLGVYVLLRGIAHFIVEFSQGLDERSYLWPQEGNRNNALKEAALRGVFRTAAFIGLTVLILGPFFHLLHGPVLAQSLGSVIALRFFVWFVLLWLTMHGGVVLTRLIALRPRLFGQ